MMIRANRRSFRTLVAATALAVGVVPLLGSPAHAAITYYGAEASAAVQSSTFTQTMTITPTTTPLAGWEAGQWVIYRVTVQDRTSSTYGAAKTYAWQGPFWVTKSSATTSNCTSYDVILGGGDCGYVTSDTSQTVLGSFDVTGYAGHRYAAAVQIGYWDGSKYWMTRNFKTQACYNTYELDGVALSAYGGTCAT